MPILRTLGRSPVFAASAILTMALGTGANTGAFCALNSLLLKPLPYPEPGRLVTLYETAADGKPRGVAEANLLDWRRRSDWFEHLAAWQPRSFGLSLREQDSPIVIQTGMVMADFFPAVGTPPALGRVFSEEEEVAESRYLVLTDRLWRNQFGAEPDAVGRKVWINEAPFTIIGVMPAGFEFPMGNIVPDAFLPLSRSDYCCARLGAQSAMARLKPGVTLAAAGAGLKSVAAALAQQYPATNGGRSAGLTPLEDTMQGSRREPLTLLMAAAGLLLAIACANAGGLMAARTLARSREIAIRAALGANRRQVALPFLGEAAAISIAGSALGLIAARFLLQAIPAFLPGPEVSAQLQLDGRSFGFACAVALCLTLILGLAPLARLGPVLEFRAGPSRSKVRSVLVAAQVALSVVLLCGVGLLLRSLWNLSATNPGFETAHALRFGIGLPESRYDTDNKLIAFHHRLLDRLHTLAGVEEAGAATRLPLRDGNPGPGGFFQIAGANIPAPQRPRAWFNTVSPGYLRAMGIPLLEGRDFSWRDDRPGGRRVAIVNRTFAATYLKGRRAIGTLLDLGNPPATVREVIGVAADTRQASLDREPVPEIILPMTQLGADGATYVVRTRRDEPALFQAISAAVAAEDPRIQRIVPAPLQLVVERNLASRTASIEIFGVFGGLALALTAVGIYGVMAFRAAERSREMAIRMALGATPRHVRGLLLIQAARLALWGTAGGFVLFALLGRFLRSQLYGVGIADPAIVAAAGGAMLAVALAAAAAARTTRVDLLRDSS